MVPGKSSKIQEYTDTMDQLIQQGLEKRERATKLIATVNQKIQEARVQGMDTSKPLALLQKAQHTLTSASEISAFDDAINYAKNANNMISKLKNQFIQTRELLNTAKRTLAETERIGVNIGGPQKLIDDADLALSKHDFDAAKRLSTKSIGMLSTVRANYLVAKKEINDALGKITSLKSSGQDTSELEKLLEDATSNMQSGRYKTAIKLAKECLSKLGDVSASTTTPIIASALASSKLNQQVPTVGKPHVVLEYPGVRTFKSSRWGKLELELTNDGSANATDIELKLSDDVESRGFKVIPLLKPGEKQVLSVGIRTNELGEIPVNVSVKYLNIKTNETYSFDEEVWIKNERGELVEQGDAGVPRKPITEPQAPPTTSGVVNVLSEVEVFQGFVRLKVGVKNEMNMVITDAKFDLEFDENAMRLDRIEPVFERKGNKVILGVIHPQEKRTMAFYLDPIICTESHIDGTLVYKNIYGELKTTAMKRRKAEVVCPILYTPENINTAMLNRLVNEELPVHDNKIYQIPAGLDYERAMSICKDTILSHDLKFVREFLEHDESDPEIEAWYYGTTKVKKHKVVIKASTRKNTNTIELFVACKDKYVITGFLAELGHNFNDKLRELGVVKQPIFPVTDDETRGKISQSSSLLQHQYSEKTTLSISKRGNEYEVSFKGSEEHGFASELCEFIKVSPDSRLDVIDQINNIVTILNIFTCTRGTDIIPSKKVLEKAGINNLSNELIRDKINDLSSLGQLIYTMFLPVPIQKHLETIEEPVILKTNDNEIPWELLHDDKNFLCLKVPIGRRLRSREIPRSNQTSRGDKIKMLFIANPTGDLEGAEEEVDYILKNLDPNIEVEVLKGSQATNTSILSALRSGKFDIIHYSGHAEFNINQPDESALICANKRKIYAQEIKRILGGKPFVFLNACGSGREKMCEEGESYTGSDTEGLASSFILGGSLAFIGSSWPLPDISAGILASEFYKNVLAGESVGEALFKARLHLKTVRPDDINWMAFILYGDPTIKLT